MSADKAFDCVQFQRERRAQIGRELAGLTPEEQAKWIQEQAASYRLENLVQPSSETTKSA